MLVFVTERLLINSRFQPVDTLPQFSYKVAMNRNFFAIRSAVVFILLLNSSIAGAAAFHCELQQGFAAAKFVIAAPEAPLAAPSYQKFNLLDREIVFSFWPAGTRANKLDFLYVSIDGTQGEHVGLYYDYPVRLISAEFEAGTKDPFQQEVLSCGFDPQG